jgi:hypothetical protein
MKKGNLIYPENKKANPLSPPLLPLYVFLNIKMLLFYCMLGEVERIRRSKKI